MSIPFIHCIFLYKGIESEEERYAFNESQTFHRIDFVDIKVMFILNFIYRCFHRQCMNYYRKEPYGILRGLSISFIVNNLHIQNN